MERKIWTLLASQNGTDGGGCLTAHVIARKLAVNRRPVNGLLYKMWQQGIVFKTRSLPPMWSLAKNQEITGENGIGAEAEHSGAIGDGYTATSETGDAETDATDTVDMAGAVSRNFKKLKKNNNNQPAQSCQNHHHRSDATNKIKNLLKKNENTHQVPMYARDIGLKLNLSRRETNRLLYRMYEAGEVMKYETRPPSWRAGKLDQMK